jgi:hypothetical protein
MGIVLGIFDFIVLLGVVILVPRTVRKELPRGTGSLVLSLCTLFVVIVFGIISFSAFLGLVGAS